VQKDGLTLTVASEKVETEKISSRTLSGDVLGSKRVKSTISSDNKLMTENSSSGKKEIRVAGGLAPCGEMWSTRPRERGRERGIHGGKSNSRKTATASYKGNARCVELTLKGNGTRPKSRASSIEKKRPTKQSSLCKKKNAVEGDTSETATQFPKGPDSKESGKKRGSP